MANTAQAEEKVSTLENIIEQIKIVIVVYGIIAVIHLVSVRSNLMELGKATLVSFVLVVLSILLKNFVKKPNLPGFAWSTLVAFALTLPISPVADFIVNTLQAYSFGLVGIPLLAFAGIAVGEQLEVFKKLSWKIVLIAFVVMASTYFGSALISNIVLALNGMI
ncbi:MAG: hypothetical protein U0L12_02120 [Ruminococcus sp.]|nr:hypothetical protein [Ruminococcus sp.]